MNLKRFGVVAFALLAMFFFTTQLAWSQTTLSTGSIEGTVTDAQGAVIPAAHVTITSRATGAVMTATVTSSGTFSSGQLQPGNYVIDVESSGFKKTEMPIVVQVGNISSARVTLQVGVASTVVTVEASGVTVNTEQATIQGVVTPEQIENLPINGRNFLDLAQLQPGVQIQDGGNFDPTKKGFSSVSFGGRFGRTARIEVDGLDISDETVGTTTQNVPENSIQEFQVSQSTLDISTELTSSGTLNITTKSGTNSLHGGGFWGYRSNNTAAAIGNPGAVFNRKQYGADLGGPIIKDKLFGFGAWERTTQDLLASVVVQQPFQALSGSFNSPFRDQMFLGRVDYNVTSTFHLFGKFAYEQNRDVGAFVPGTYQPFANVDNTPTYGVGADFTTGSWTHQIRFGYLKFRNNIASAISGGIINPAPALALAIGNVSTSCTTAGDLFCSGPNILAPQATYQSDKQFKYDATKVLGTHTLRLGFGYNKILGGGFASFFGIAPAVRSHFNAANEALAATGPFSGGITNPLNYPTDVVEMGNGEGCFTEIPQFGQSCGGQYDSRFEWYVGDSWKVRPNLTFMYGLRYNRDTGRTDSDLAAIPLLDQVCAGCGNPVRQPNKNYGGLIGLAWDPTGSGKTVIRAGAGVYYENGVFNNILFDRPGRLQQGLFNGVSVACPNTTGTFTMPDGSVVSTAGICGQPIGSAENAIAALQSQFQSITKSLGPQGNGAYIGNAFTASPGTTGVTLFAPNFQTPRSYQMNVGIQRELHPGTVLSVDYLRNVSVHTLLAIDENHVGAAQFLDQPAALTAIANTNQSFGCPTSTAGIDCAIAAGATVANYAANGITSGTLATGGFATGPGVVAFPGQNPNFGLVEFLKPIGRAVYNGMQVTLKSDLRSPLPFITRMNTQISYSLSRFDSQATDIDFVNGAADFNDPGRFIGPGSLDRTHQLSAGVVMAMRHGLEANFITHWYTALPQTLLFAPTGNPEDLLQLDTYGDGQQGVAPIPGSQVGDFGRSIKAGQLNAFLQKYSTASGNQLTPAGQALVSAGLFTQTQLQELCAITPSLNPINNCAAAFPNLQLSPAPAGQVGNSPLFTFDASLGWHISPVHRWENFHVTPEVRFFNLFNRANYNDAASLLSGVLDGAAGSVNGTTSADRAPLRLGLGSGVFSLGAPRTIEFGIKAEF